LHLYFFINKGSNTVNVNNLKLAENESLNISQPGDYLDRSQYQVSFDGDGTASDLVIIRIYQKIKVSGKYLEITFNDYKKQL